jgi:hypothetical protein
MVAILKRIWPEPPSELANRVIRIFEYELRILQMIEPLSSQDESKVALRLELLKEIEGLLRRRIVAL